MRVRSYAKVNLALCVGPAIPASQANAGYHPIASWMHAIDLCDEIDLDLLDPCAAGGGGMSTYVRTWTDGSACPWPEERDLAVRAHRLFEQELGRRVPIRYAIRKQIPAGGGLGGGSSNAASVLMALNGALGHPVEHTRLLELSRSIGSDVAFFLDEVAAGGPPRPAIVEGLGDRIERVNRRMGSLVLVMPTFGCETRAVYRAYDAAPRALRDRAVRELATGEPGAKLPAWEPLNDLFEPACRVCDGLGDMALTLERLTGRRAHMSGSGSTLFVLVGDSTDARAICGQLSPALPRGTRCAVAPLV